MHTIGELVTYGRVSADQQQREALGEVLRAEVRYGTGGYVINPLTTQLGRDEQPAWWPAAQVSGVRNDLWEYDRQRAVYRRQHISHDAAARP